MEAKISTIHGTSIDAWQAGGVSLFETLRVKNGACWRLIDHFHRMADSAQVFGIEPPSQDDFLQLVQSTAAGIPDAVVRLTLAQLGGRWSNRRGCELLATARPFDSGPSELRLSVVDSLPVGDQMRLHKTGSRIAYARAHGRALESGAHDALLIDRDGFLLETTRANLYVRASGSPLWRTPPLKRCLLPGIHRAWMIASGLAREDDISLTSLGSLDQVAVGSAVRGLVAVSAVDQLKFSSESVDATLVARQATQWSFSFWGWGKDTGP